MKKWIWSISVVLLGGIPIMSVARNTRFSMADSVVSARYHIVRTVPETFRLLSDREGITIGVSWRYDEHTGRTWKEDMKKVRTVLLGSLLQSDDRQCAVMFEDIDVFQFYGDPKLSSIVPGLYTQQNLKHRNHILSILRARLDRWEVDPDAFLSIVSGREARRRFGADSIFMFEVPIEPQELAGETYTRCIHQVLSRRDRAYLGFVWFFTDEGYERRAEYLSALEGAVYYKRGRWRKPEWVRRQKEN